jgi:hypothetical protein
MELIFSSSAFGAFNALTAAARGIVPSQPLSSTLLEAAVKFTIQFAIAAAQRDQDKARRTFGLVAGRQAGAPSEQPQPALERELLAELATWRDKEGAPTLRLWTHDISCVLEALDRAARRYAYPSQVSADMLKQTVEALPRHLTVAAVAFTVQLAIEETERDASEMRALEAELISELEKPWAPFKVPLSVDVQEGPSWGPSPEEG